MTTCLLLDEDLDMGEWYSLRPKIIVLVSNFDEIKVRSSLPK